eukprot:2689176-Amphidinium_carterae.1
MTSQRKQSTSMSKFNLCLKQTVHVTYALSAFMRALAMTTNQIQDLLPIGMNRLSGHSLSRQDNGLNQNLTAFMMKCASSFPRTLWFPHMEQDPCDQPFRYSAQSLLGHKEGVVATPMLPGSLRMIALR